jgi:hypothetical protein
MREDHIVVFVQSALEC